MRRLRRDARARKTGSAGACAASWMGGGRLRAATGRGGPNGWHAVKPNRCTDEVRPFSVQSYHVTDGAGR